MRIVIAAPWHAIFVHFTVALTFTSFVFDLAGALLDQVPLSTSAWWMLAAAAVMTFGTVVSGVVSRARLPVEEGAARSYLRGHMAIGPMVLGLLLVVLTWRAGFWQRGAIAPWSYLAAAAGLLILVTVQGYLGGELVYRFGCEVRGRFTPLPSTRAGRGPGVTPERRS